MVGNDAIKPAVALAAKDDAAVGDGEDVLPEGVGGPERLHHRQVVLEPLGHAGLRLGAQGGADQAGERQRQQQPMEEGVQVHEAYGRGLRGDCWRASGTKCWRAGIVTAARVVLSITASAAMSSLAWSRNAVRA